MEAEKKAAPLRKKWKAEFKRIRNAGNLTELPISAPLDEESIAPSDNYLQHYRTLMLKNLPALIDLASDDELHDMSGRYAASVEYIQDADNWSHRRLDLPELEETDYIPTGKTPGQTRKKRRALISAQ